MTSDFPGHGGADPSVRQRGGTGTATVPFERLFQIASE